MLIASDHRVFGITEKSAAGDGSVDRELILEMGQRYARTFIHFDMSEIVQRQGTVISAALLGAIAGSGAPLPAIAPSNAAEMTVPCR